MSFQVSKSPLLATALLLVLAAVLSLGLRTILPVPQAETGGGFDGLQGVATGSAAQPPGIVDEYGYLQPIDVIRPRPPRNPPPRLSLESIESRRALRAKANPFEVRVGPLDGHTHTETSIDIEGDTLVGGWNQYTDSGIHIGWARSADRGQSWTHSQFDGFSKMSDPVVKAGGNGVWYFAYIGSDSDWDVYMHRSTDDGLTWGQPVAVTENATFDDKPYIDATGDEVLVAWSSAVGYRFEIHATRSLDGGQTFNNPTRLSLSSPGGLGAGPVIGNDGTYYVFWRSGSWFVWMARSTDQGQTWETDVAISSLVPLPNPLPGQGFRINNLPSAAVDPVSGDLVVVWNDQRFGDPDIVSIRSSDNGDTWSAPIKVSDDSNGTSQFFPWLTFDEIGTASVVWYDQRQNGSGIDVYMAQSSDAGQSWGINTRITSASFTAVLPWESIAVDFIGDYNGVAANQGEVFPIYQDSRAGLQEIYVARLTPDQSCNDSIDCDDGIFCNGSELCIAGTCASGDDPCPGELCNEAGRVCESSTTVTLKSKGAQDGWLRESSEGSGMGGKENSLASGPHSIRVGDHKKDKQYKGLLSFDTSSIPPGARIQSATLRLRRGAVRGNDPFSSFGPCWVDITGIFGSDPSLLPEDFEADADAVAVGSLSAPSANGQWSQATLSDAGLKAIDTGGTTQLRIYFEMSDNDNRSDDYVGYYSGDSSARRRPQLVVTYR